MSELVLTGWAGGSGALTLISVPDAGGVRWLLHLAPDAVAPAVGDAVRARCGGAVDLCLGAGDLPSRLVASARWPEKELPVGLGEARLELVTEPLPGPPAAARGAGPRRPAEPVPPPGVDAGAFYDLLASRPMVAAGAGQAAGGGLEVPQLVWGPWRVRLLPAGWRVTLGVQPWALWQGSPSDGPGPVDLRLPG